MRSFHVQTQWSEAPSEHQHTYACADVGGPSHCFAPAVTSTWTPDPCPLWLLNSYLSFKVQFACHLLQEACVGTGDTGANMVDKVIALPSVP